MCSTQWEMCAQGGVENVRRYFAQVQCRLSAVENLNRLPRSLNEDLQIDLLI